MANKSDIEAKAFPIQVQRISDNGSGICLWSFMTDYPFRLLLEPKFWSLILDHRGGGLMRHDRIEVTASADGNRPEHALLVVGDIIPGVGVSMDVLRGPERAAKKAA